MSEKNKANASSAVPDAEREAVQRAVRKVHFAAVVIGGAADKDTFDAKLCRKLALIVYEHGEKGVERATMAANYDNAVSPTQLPTGYAMEFNAAEAPIVLEALPLLALNAGTMAYRVEARNLQGSPLTRTGPMLHANELVQKLDGMGAALEPNKALPDSYAGLFSHEKRNKQDYEHDYFVVVRDVEPKHNEHLYKTFADAAHNKQTLQSALVSSRVERIQALKAQRATRAQKVSDALAAFNINVGAQEILQNLEHNLVDNVSTSLLSDDDCNKAMLLNNVVAVNDQTLHDGLILNDTLRLGPTLLQGTPLARGEVPFNELTVFPSTVPTVVSAWSAAAGVFSSSTSSSSSKPSLDDKCKRGTPTSAYTWSSKEEHHPMLARDLYVSSASDEWIAHQEQSGFESAKSKQLRPLAVKLR